MTRAFTIGDYANIALKVVVGGFLCFLAVTASFELVEAVTGWQISYWWALPWTVVVGAAAVYATRFADRMTEPAPPLTGEPSGNS